MVKDFFCGADFGEMRKLLLEYGEDSLPLELRISISTELFLSPR